MDREIDFADVLDERAGFYRLLGAMFVHEVDADLLHTIKDLGLEGLGQCEEFDKGCALLKEYFEQTEISEAEVENLAVDYARVIVGACVSDGKAAYPYESVYTSRQHLVMQQAWEDVCKVYRQYGFARGEGCDVLEDHVGLECEFMSKLCSMSAESQRKGDTEALAGLLEAQRDFARDHLNNWIDAFCRDVSKYTESNFYKAATLILLGFVRGDLALLEDVLAQE